MIHFNYLVQNMQGITVIMIDTGRNEEWFNIAKQSVLDQMYPLKLVNAEKNEWAEQVELLIYPNRDKKLSIGACWNKLVKKAKYDYIFILDDDDRIVPMMLFNLMFQLQTLRLDEKNKDIIGVTPYVTFMSKHEGQTYHKISHTYTSGLAEKEWLLKIPFREDAKKHVDMRWDDDILKQNKYIALQRWNVGYMYRQHTNMVSGQNMHMRYIDDDLNRIIDIDVPYVSKEK